MPFRLVFHAALALPLPLSPSVRGHPNNVEHCSLVGRCRSVLLKEPVKEGSAAWESGRTTFAGPSVLFPEPFGNNPTLDVRPPTNNPVKNLQWAVVTPTSALETDYGQVARPRRGRSEVRYSGNISTVSLVYQREYLAGVDGLRARAVKPGGQGESLL